MNSAKGPACPNCGSVQLHSSRTVVWVCYVCGMFPGAAAHDPDQETIGSLFEEWGRRIAQKRYPPTYICPLCDDGNIKSEHHAWCIDCDNTPKGKFGITAACSKCKEMPEMCMGECNQCLLEGVTGEEYSILILVTEAMAFSEEGNSDIAYGNQSTEDHIREAWAILWAHHWSKAAQGVVHRLMMRLATLTSLAVLDPEWNLDKEWYTYF